MTFSNRFTAGATAVLITSAVLLSAGLTGRAQAAYTFTRQITLTQEVRLSTCTLQLPTQVSLGTLLKGSTSDRTPFSISAGCDMDVNSFVYAEVVKGKLTPGSVNSVEMTSAAGATGTPARLWLTDDAGNNITLDGSGKTDRSKAFCLFSGGPRTCRLTPRVQVATDTPAGGVSASVRFTVMYY